MSTEIPEPQTNTSTNDVDVVRRVYEAFTSRDVPALFALFDEDGTIYQSSRVPWGGDFRGHEGMGEFLGKLTGAIQSQVETERYIADEDGHVIAIGHTRGHVIATGEPFDVPEVHLWTVENGKVTRFESYIDTGKMRAALGL
ncbi:MAG TPA: nuclear transport factor 2 family protein [Thermomicrobiales bacterium]|nr:nuclear transport factor 2 family protein [Thermomicrobiales bacterium]